MVGASFGANFTASNVLYVGANATNSDLNHGVCYFNNNSVSNTNANIGGRLLVTPKITRASAIPHLSVKINQLQDAFSKSKIWKLNEV